MTSSTGWLIAIGAGAVTLGLRWLPLLIPGGLLGLGERGRLVLDRVSYAILGGIVSTSSLTAAERLGGSPAAHAAAIAAAGLAFLLAVRGRGSLAAALAGVAIYLAAGAVLRP